MTDSLNTKTKKKKSQSISRLFSCSEVKKKKSISEFFINFLKRKSEAVFLSQLQMGLGFFLVLLY